MGKFSCVKFTKQDRQTPRLVGKKIGWGETLKTSIQRWEEGVVCRQAGDVMDRERERERLVGIEEDGGSIVWRQEDWKTGKTRMGTMCGGDGLEKGAGGRKKVIGEIY